MPAETTTTRSSDNTEESTMTTDTLTPPIVGIEPYSPRRAARIAGVGYVAMSILVITRGLRRVGAHVDERPSTGSPS